MRILVVGTDRQLNECRGKFAGHDITGVSTHDDLDRQTTTTDIIFDFMTSDAPETFEAYRRTEVTAFLNTWKISLRQLVYNYGSVEKATLFGFNGFPTMFNRELLEVSTLRDTDASKAKDSCRKLNTAFRLVDDRVGLVTPRVVCMIINEAYYTVQEGTATREDIDLAMKLGTNYPFGPFEWCHMIGLKYVYELLNALYQDTRDERYKVSALMKKEYLEGHRRR